jgi:hypothetical protein
MQVDKPKTESRIHRPFNLARIAGNVLAFIIPCLMFLEVNAIGRLFASEVILLLLLPLLLYFRFRWLAQPQVKRIIFFILIWLVAQILTDAIRATPFADLSRGWSKITFFLLNFIALYLLLSVSRFRVKTFCAGMVVGQFATFFLVPTSVALEYPWKFGLGYPVTISLVLISQSTIIKRIRYGTEIVIVSAAVLNLLLGFRTLALICLATAVYVYFNKRSVQRGTSYQLSKLALAKLLVLLVGATIATTEGYKYAAHNDWLSEKETQKYMQQASGQYGALLSSRPEFLASSVAIMDSPLIGHGSWAKDPKYNAIIAYVLADLGYENPHTYIGLDDLIPSHSHVFGAWVESGVIGALFWGWVWLFVLKALWKLTNTKEELLPLVAFVGLNVMWHVLFSPFGAENRVYMAYYLVLILFALHQRDGSMVTKRMETA